MGIRRIERIIDVIHESHPFFELSKQDAIIKLLVAFEDLSSLAMMTSILYPLSINQIRDYMDALNMALKWVGEKCEEGTENEGSTFSEADYQLVTDLLLNYALPYSEVCSGYVSYSRERMTACVEGNTVTFNLKDDHNGSAWADILREVNDSSLEKLTEAFNPKDMVMAFVLLKDKIFTEDGQLYYPLDEDSIKPFKEIATYQWNITKTLPDSWKFDSFSLQDYKSFWIAITTLSYIHFVACMMLTDPMLRLKNAVIMESKEKIITILKGLSDIEGETIERIIDYITYNPQKRNGDIMYQPIIDFSGTIVITPLLFMGSNPERNILAVINSKHDHEHSKEVNNLEGLMISELDSVICESDNLRIQRHKPIPVSDIDYAILDKTTSSAMLCEIKWFAAADSTSEVYAREDEINHGCDQMETIMAYAMKDKRHFFKSIFDVDNGEEIDIFCCVIARHNIRTQNKHVPVIDLKRIKELLSIYSVNTVFHMIRNHEYEYPIPECGEITHQDIDYGGYTFRIPAIAFGCEITSKTDGEI